MYAHLLVQTSSGCCHLPSVVQETFIERALVFRNRKLSAQVYLRK